MLHTYGRDYCAIFVGDASMSPYEITQPGGSIEHWNREAGAVWLERLVGAFPRLVWLNAAAAERWSYTPSVRISAELLQQRMFPLTMAGLDLAIGELKRPLGGVGRGGATSITQAPTPEVP